MGTRVQLQPAWLLSARPYRETSLLLEAFSRDHGRVGLVARGARGPRSRLRGLLQPLQPLLLSWQQGGELATLSGAEAAGPPLRLSGERLFYAWYVNELVLRLLQRQDAHTEIWDAYRSVLTQLEDAQPAFALRLFEKHLLAGIGYGLWLDENLDPRLRYAVDDEGQWLATPDGPYAGLGLIALRDEVLPAEAASVLPELRRLLQAQIRRQLGDRELETPKLLKAFRAQSGERPSEKR